MNPFNGLFVIQYWVALALGLAMLGVEVVAFVDCLRHRDNAYAAAGKLTKNKWMLITGIALVVGFLTVRNPIGFMGVIAIVAASVYLVDVKPALRQVLTRSQTRSDGPYGPW